MATFIEDLVDYVDANTALTAATDLFGEWMQSTPDVQVAIAEPPGAPPLQSMGGGFPSVGRPRIQVTARGGVDDAISARVAAHAVYSVLAAVVDVLIGTRRVHRIDPLQEPFFLYRDESDRPIYAFNLDVYMEPE